jgi:hypothetical protein
MKCPHCGAENADSSEFCSLCLARFNAGSDARMSNAAQPLSPERDGFEMNDAVASQPRSEQYVSPGDYHALAREMQETSYTASPEGSYRETAFYQAAMQHPGSISSVQVPRGSERSATNIVLLVLKHSLLMYFVLLAVNFFLAFAIAGMIESGGITGFNIGTAILYIVEMFLLIWAGYRISAEAMEAGNGWLYGMACVGAIVFFWQPLIAFLIGLIITGKAFAPIFNIYGLMIAVFLYIPMGALGGWIAEKRFMG